LGGDTPAILGRHEAYIGVLIDDLVTKGVDEPYRLFTSRAEYRLILRESNAEERLWRQAAAWGLLPEDRVKRAAARDTARSVLRETLNTQRADPGMLARLGLTGRMVPGSTLGSLLRRPEITLAHLFDGIDDEIALVVEESVKYAGYIDREAREIARMSELENYRLPETLNYLTMNGLSNEVRSKLQNVRPLTLGQASRISGVTPTSLALIRVLAYRHVSRETSVA
jgi:tRNA uridine 5-carboxymethylaminomethyl modification enzyme